MATNRVIVDSDGRQFSCDSMDRFGDDLCQLIVGYLPFEDKTRLEGVAKQWRRVMDYNMIKTLHVIRYYRDWFRLQFTNRDYKVIETFDSGSNSLIFKLRSDAEEDYKLLKTLFDKCLNIRKIVFNRIDIRCPLIAVIDKYCKRLDSMLISECQLSEELIPLFGSDLGPKVKDLEFNFNKGLDLNQVVANCPNIESLKCSSFSVLSNRSEVFLAKLKSLESWIDTNNVSLLADFVHKHKELKRLSFFTSPVSPKQLIDVLNAISLLKDINDLKLQVLSHDSRGDQLLVNIDRELQQIGRNCRQLKRFSLDVKYNIVIDGNVWRNLVEFQALESLELNLDTTIDQSMALMGLKKNIKRIYFKFGVAREDIFANIHQIVPNLKSFTFRPYTEVTDKLLDSLSHLNHLKDVFIDAKYKKPKITESGVNRLLANSPQLTRFEVQGFVEILIYKREKKIIHWNESSDSESESSDTESE